MIDALAALDAHQAVLLAAVDHAVGLSDQSPDAAHADLAKARWDVVRRARAYQVFKHREIFDPGLLTGTPRQVAMARQMKDACLAAGTAVEDYAAHWTGKDIVAEWSTHRAGLTSLAADVRVHIATERRSIVAFMEEETGREAPGTSGRGY